MNLLVLFIVLLIPVLPLQALAEGKVVKSNAVIEITAGAENDDATSGTIETEGDPIEPVNRGIFTFNQTLDDIVLQPIARTYRDVVPEAAREKVGNFFDNLRSPVVFVNSVLQGDADNAFRTFWRFFINSTFGIGGLYDTGQEVGLLAHEEDFGQTAAVYGAGDGAYVVLPILGPSSVRDALGLALDSLTNPFNYLPGGAVAGLAVGSGVQTRSEGLELTDEIERTSFDPYSAYRSAYQQHREDLIRNGNAERGTVGISGQ